MLNFHSEALPQVCLIVENMDTYHYLQFHAPNHWMLVCGLGQRVTKQSVLDANIVDLHASAQTPDHVRQACKSFWLNPNSKCFYWGDLDSNGKQIFQTLKK
nr:Wadjet anti-phage system protein JetD domain-containing protein [Reinekea sp. G2M2-21]